MALKTTSCTSFTTGFSDVIDGQVWTLNRFSIDLPAYNVINKWNVGANYYYRRWRMDGRRFRMNYIYCALRNTEAEIVTYNANKPANMNPNNNVRLLEEKYFFILILIQSDHYGNII